MHRLVVSFLGLFYSDGRLMLLYYMEGGSGGPPGEILAEYVLKCDILDQFGRKTLHTGQFLDIWVLEWY